jgi:hypothetical protein
LTSVDLPTFGRPATATTPHLIRRPASRCAWCRVADVRRVPAGHVPFGLAPPSRAAGLLPTARAYPATART